MRVVVSVGEQSLSVFNGEALLKRYSISTAKSGVGETKNSGKTPSGRHVVRAKIGKNAPINAVFVGRRETGEIYTDALAKQLPDRDWILTRILWLSGLERGKNRLGNVDSMQRFIYIHGTPDSEPMGVPLSHGCVRMRNSDVIELFDSLPVGTVVEILP